MNFEKLNFKVLDTTFTKVQARLRTIICSKDRARYISNFAQIDTILSVSWPCIVFFTRLCILRLLLLSLSFRMSVVQIYALSHNVKRKGFQCLHMNYSCVEHSNGRHEIMTAQNIQCSCSIPHHAHLPMISINTS